jgi:glycogen debranching enzyme
LELHAELKELVNGDMWSDEDQFYWDIDRDGSFLKTKTIASFWPLWGRLTEEKHVKGLVKHLNDPNSFNRPHRVPTTAADEEAYHPEGYYWQGSVWAPTNHMIAKGLEANSQHKLAREIVQNHINIQSIVFRDQNTVYENYAPEYIRPGQPWSRDDFVGWSADGPIAQLIEHYIGIKIDAPNNKIRWDLLTIEEVGLENLKLNDATIKLRASKREAPDDPVELEVETDQAFMLELNTDETEYLKKITAGKHQLTFQNQNHS